jgi:LAO/AO transport system kinase
MGLVDRVLTGDLGALARLATHVENDTDVGQEALAALYPQTGRAHTVGITGAPGSGKSTLVGALIKEVRTTGRTVGVVAVDPSSSLTGGATLGDRIRMLDAWADPGVFIRSMASRGRRGGVAPATAGLIHLLDAAGFDLILVETVGVGQEEIDVVEHVHTVVLLQVPGLGDDVQAIKAGVIEVADIYVVNKADRPGANDIARGLRALVGPLAHRDGVDWTPPILKSSATNGDGITELQRAIDDHHQHLRRAHEWEQRVATIARSEVRALTWRQILNRIEGETPSMDAEHLIAAVANRAMTPAAAVDRLLDRTQMAKSST